MQSRRHFWAKTILLALAVTVVLPVFCSTVSLPTTPAVASSSSCHHSAPVAPAPQQKCCFAGRTPQAVLSGRYVVPQSDVLCAVTNVSQNESRPLKSVPTGSTNHPTSPLQNQILRI
jgi:hypothetical protein